MNLLRIKDLQRLATHCGYRTDVSKLGRIAAIAETGAFFERVLGNRPNESLDVLSVDVGLKNFSYSKVSYQQNTADIKEWAVVNLHSKYGTPEYIDEGSLVDLKAYMAKLAVSVVDNVLISSLWVPKIITIENQRTRSNSSKATLPNVLLNFTFEHMLYAAFVARQTTNPAYESLVVMPMNANKMVSFWLSRYIAKGCPYSPSRSKTYRKNMLYGWLKAPHIAPFDISSFTNLLPADFPSMGTNLLNTSLRLALNIEHKGAKVDDLVDSLLYNLSIARQIFHHQEIQTLAAAHDKDGILARLEQWDVEHLKFIEPVLNSSDLFLATEYQDHVSKS
ncbi:Ydc2-catalyt-domain-containing protein [Metschnikowia bicuspidata var. bicuspidata NRRL YB-4993]|uniref:Ydc2-catalyt-domain-containing protein n=1 Tax=Metschnikowia bicuspidata var. bicuspidata NRRL YB-4993 TaxID=869754 RepID=A0A1A0H9G5_9ASCO|nr:Ydc2-catalyt-domain-containing protein [Metschnikowia bicuspidata var. bicuspidata NRRL YB-4993]OBA20661.1 Ydc2-catalyt-domain-containing protein [Metschnikowia bicuspidata var. bicuspidata NRRL YB-4993]